MTEEQFTKRIEELFAFGIDKMIKGECRRLFKSGAIDPENHGDDFLLPKLIMTVALQNIADQYMPSNTKVQREVRNLRRF